MQFITPEQLSHMLSLPMSFIYDHTRKGSPDPIPGAFKFGKHLRFKVEEESIPFLVEIPRGSM